MKQLLSIWKGSSIALLLFIIFSLQVSIGRTQIPNADFEVWANGEPDGWLTTNHAPTLTTITQTSPGESGASAAKGDVAQIATITVAPSLITGHNDGGTFVHGFATSSRPAALNGFYKFTSVGSDRFSVGVTLSKNGVGIGAGFFQPTATVSSYTAFSAPIQYPNQDTPDTCDISITILPLNTSAGVHAGSSFVIDNLSFGPASAVHTSISARGVFGLEQNYPNPVGTGTGSLKPTTMIRFSLPKDGFTTLKVYDIRGVEVANLLGGVELGGTHEVFFEAAKMAPGMYCYRLTSGALSETRWMQILR